MTFVIIWALILGCGQNTETGQLESNIGSLEKEFDKSDLEIIENEVVRFSQPLIKNITENRFKEIYESLHRNNKNYWDENKFIDDMRKIKLLIGDDWATELTGSFKGETVNGPYIQATYKIGKKWDSPYSIQFTAVKDGKEYKISQIISNLPYAKNQELPRTAKITANEFIQNLQSNNFSSLEELSLLKSNENSKNIYTQIRKLLVDEDGNKRDLEYREYQKYANTIWYDTISCYPRSGISFFTFLELNMLKEDDVHKVAHIGGRFMY